MLSQGERNHSSPRLPLVGSAASRGTASRPSRCGRPHPPLGRASRPASGRGLRTPQLASLCGRGESSRRPAERGFLGYPESPGIARGGAARGCLTGKVACAPGALGKAAARGGASAELGRLRSPAPTTHAPGGSAITDWAGGYRLERGNPGRREREGNLAAAARALPVSAPHRVGLGRTRGGRLAWAAHACSRSRWRRGRLGGGGARQ